MICPQVTLDIALTDKAISIQSIASQHKISRTHVRRCFGAVALALCAKQAAFLAALPNLLKHAGRAPAVIYDRLKFDETRQRLRIPHFENLATLDQQCCSWAVLVQRRVFGMVLTTGERLEWRLSTRPCVMIASKSAGCYWDAIMENGKAVGKNQKEEINPSLVTALIADVVSAFPDCKCLAVAEVDADSSVQKMLSHKANQASSNIYIHLFF